MIIEYEGAGEKSPFSALLCPISRASVSVQEEVWVSFPEPSAARIVGLFASFITNSTEGMPDEFRDTFHTGISLFAFGYQCTTNFWAHKLGQMLAGDQRGGEQQGVLVSCRFPADGAMSNACPGQQVRWRVSSVGSHGV